MEKNFDSEFDYTLEARNLNEVRDIILPKWGNKVYIPRPYLEYTSKHVLVMEFLNGTSLMKGLQQHFTALAELMNINIEELEAQKELMMRNNSFPYRSLEEEKQLGRKLRRASWIRGLVKGRPQRSSSFSSKWGSDFLDLAYIVKTLFQEHASEMFDAGACNTDCHPGNVLLMHDGRLGLLDYGQVKRMELSHRISFARMIMAIARDDREEILRLHFDEIGVKTKYRNETIGYLASAFYYDRDTPDILGDKDVVNFMEYIEAQDPMVQLPEPFIMAWKGNAILRGVAKILGIQVRTSQVWRNQAASFLKAHGF